MQLLVAPPVTTTPIGVRRTLSRLGLSPRKVLGQHFLIDPKVLRAIAKAAELTPQDTVVEIGPGLGVLTREVVKRVFPGKKPLALVSEGAFSVGGMSSGGEPGDSPQDAGCVIAVEMDEELSAALTVDLGPSVRVVTADARRVDIPWLVGGRSGYKLLGNLPYYAATAIVRRFLEGPCKPVLAVIMMQWEVAQRVVALPGQMSLLSVAVQLYGKPSIVQRVPASAFYPSPKVTSAVVRIEVYPRPVLELKDVEAFFGVVRAGFSAPRKQLRNALAQGLGVIAARAEEFLRGAEIDPRCRAERLSLEEWGRLYQVVVTSDGPH